MPFVESSRMERRIGLLSDYDTGAFSVTALCARYGIDRSTFYLWHSRRAGGDARWFADRSHAPRSCPHRTVAEVEAAVIAVRTRYPHFGPKKILAWLEREAPGRDWPAASTIGDIVKRSGLVAPRRIRRRGVAVDPQPLWPDAPNVEWACDFKGWFRTRDGRRCDPLTVTDAYSRYLLEVRITDPSIAGVRPVFEQLFQAHGLPQAIRCDNGPPFGSDGAGGLTRLSAWWLKLGVRPHFIRPASPQDNGRHERMHRELKGQTSRPAAATLGAQQARFDAFRAHYNEERPHEALGQVAPASLWQASRRTMPERVPEPWYDADHEARTVQGSGDIKWRQGRVFVSESLAGEVVGITAQEDGSHLVRFCDTDLGVIDRSGRFRRFAPPRYRLREPPKAPGQNCGGSTRSDL
ncbi:integrase core domain-containing protein [Sphingomonas sp. CJ20]